MSLRLFRPPLLALAVAALSTGASAAERAALVIGNARYEPETGPLRNTVNDARAMAKTLRELGFSVIERTDASRDQLLKAMLEFRSRLAGAEVALFYYAGHGVTVAGANYLIPLKSGYRPDGADDVARRLMAETKLFNVEQAVADMTSGGAACNLVILDACRTHSLGGPSTTRSGGGGGGLAEMSPPAGSLIAFATDAGRTALDGQGVNGLYTSELLKHLRTPGLTVEQVFKRVRAGVMHASEGRQVPAEYSRLIGEDVFLGGPPAPPSVAATAGSAPSPPNAASTMASPVPRALEEEPPSLARLLVWAAEGRFQDVARAVEEKAAETGPGDHAYQPLQAVLEKVKNDLKEFSETSPDLETAALACERVLVALPRCLEPDDPRHDELAAKARSRRGDAFLRLGDAETALSDYETALTLQPGDMYFRYNRASALLALGRAEEARAEFQTAASSSHNQPGARKLALEALARMRPAGQ
jgi:uncharacterized caspase-like protein